MFFYVLLLIKKLIKNVDFKFKDFEVPDYVYEKLKIPSLEKVEFRNLKQFFTYENVSDSKMYSLIF
jgi:hypothetical protein